MNTLFNCNGKFCNSLHNFLTNSFAIYCFQIGLPSILDVNLRGLLSCRTDNQILREINYGKSRSTEYAGYWQN